MTNLSNLLSRVRRASGQTFVAALLALLFLATMMGLVTTVLLVDAHAARDQRHLHAGYYAAYGGLEAAASVLLADARDADSAADAWYRNDALFRNVDLGDVEFRVECRDAAGALRAGIVDEESKLNLNTAGVEELQKLHPAFTDEVAAAVVARRQSVPFAAVEELAVVEGFDEGALATLSGLLTVFGDGRINVNTAPAATLACLPGMTMDAAKAIVASRGGEDEPKPILNLDDAEKASGLSAADFREARSRLKVASSYFCVNAVGRLKTRPDMERELRQVVRRDADAIQVVRFEQVR